MMTVNLNNIYNLICLLAALLASLPVNVLPPAVRPYIVGTAAVCMWIKSHWNLLAPPPPDAGKPPA